MQNTNSTLNGTESEALDQIVNSLEQDAEAEQDDQINQNNFNPSIPPLEAALLDIDSQRRVTLTFSRPI